MKSWELFAGRKEGKMNRIKFIVLCYGYIAVLCCLWRSDHYGARGKIRLESGGIMFLQWKKPIFGRTVNISRDKNTKRYSDIYWRKKYLWTKTFPRPRVMPGAPGVQHNPSFLLKIFHSFVIQTSGIQSEIFIDLTDLIFQQIWAFISASPSQKDCLWDWPWNFIIYAW